MGCSDRWDDPSPEELAKEKKEEEFQELVGALHGRILKKNCATFSAEELRRLINMPSCPFAYSVPKYTEVDRAFLLRMEKRHVGVMSMDHEAWMRDQKKKDRGCPGIG
jgi:hypothetical protein